MFLPRGILEEKLRQIFAEDLGQGDVTTALVIPEGTTAEAAVIARDTGIAAGIEEAGTLLESLGLTVRPLVTDGKEIKTGQTLIRIFGNARVILSVERTLLNILSRMSGIATTTRKLTEKLRKAGLETRVACTRKTAPGLMYFDKKAVMIGGGDTHRLHLDDMILIKDNHIAIVGDVAKAVKKARDQASFSKKIEVEVSKADDALAAARAGADMIMLDNFPIREIEKTIKTLIRSNYSEKILLEASGGIKAENIMAFASTGVDIVSMGEITNDTRALDMSLQITKVKEG